MKSLFTYYAIKAGPPKDPKKRTFWMRLTGRKPHVPHAYVIRYWGAPGIDLSGENLCGESYERTDLRGASFRRCLLYDCQFQGADLREADFRDAKCDAAWFMNADLRGANFTGASLEGADFTGASLEGAIGIMRNELESPVKRSGGISPARKGED
ncbi:MAG: pentapeptide repeat-containing protein [Deltaproteobacteria bacterium]|nr:pentapeptide repeat-containing protein [Deltaproteobacteria bacterium]